MPPRSLVDTTPAEQWMWCGKGTTDEKLRRKRVFYTSVKITRHLDSSTSTYSVGDAILLNADEGSKSGTKWVAQIVSLYQETTEEYKKEKKNRHIKRNEHPTYLAHRYMRCTIRWFENPRDLQFLDSDSPEQGKSEYYVTDHVEADGFHGVAEIRGRMWPFSTEQDMEAFRQNPHQDFQNDYDSLCLVRRFVKSNQQAQTRDLEPGELAYLLANPSASRNLFSSLRMRARRQTGSNAKRTASAQSTPVPKRRRATMIPEGQPFTSRQQTPECTRSDTKRRTRASQSLDATLEQFRSSQEIGSLQEPDTPRQQDIFDQLGKSENELAAPASVVTDFVLEMMKNVEASGAQDKDQTKQDSQCEPNATLKMENACAVSAEESTVRPHQSNPQQQGALTEKGPEAPDGNDKGDDSVEVIVIIDEEDEPKPQAPAGISPHEDDAIQSNEHATDTFIGEEEAAGGKETPAPETANVEMEMALGENVTDGEGSIPLVFVPAKNQGDGTIGRADSGIGEGSIAQHMVPDTEHDLTGFAGHTIEQLLNSGSACVTQFETLASREHEYPLAVAPPELGSGDNDAQDATRSVGCFHGKNDTTAALGDRTEGPTASEQVTEARVLNGRSAPPRAGKKVAIRESDIDTEVDPGEDVHEILKEFKQEFEKMGLDKQDLFCKGMNAALDLAIAKVREHGLSTHTDPGDAGVRRIVKEVMEVCTGMSSSQ